ncbi:MAG: hypothetical protein HGA45_13120 [Chloroflexales bacterium]|nr:hypothetical protein [Chloroflexales bacterium]
MGYDANNAGGTGFLGSYGIDQKLRPLWLYGRPIELHGDVTIRGTALQLNGRSGGVRRALVDWNNQQLVINFGNDYAGGVHTPGNASIGGQLNFGAQTKQHLNLWNTNYGIGVQNNTMYFRSNFNYAWYQRGSHNDEAFHSGGGELMLSLQHDGLLHSRRSLRVGGEGDDFLQIKAGGGDTDRATLRFGTNDLALWHRNVGEFVVFHGRYRIPFLFQGKSLELNRDGRTDFQRTVHIGQDLHVSGNVYVTGTIDATKKGFVVDQFINTVGEAIETGDVVVVSVQQDALTHNERGIPVPEIDLAHRPYDDRVCGIVVEAYVPNLLSVPGDTEAEAADDSESSEVQVVSSLTEVLGEDRSTVPSGQAGLMVTLGAFAHCKVDADIAPITPGDLLSTSPTPGHAQKVLDKTAAVGAILGKALEGLSSGKGKIAIFVNIQ